MLWLVGSGLRLSASSLLVRCFQLVGESFKSVRRSQTPAAIHGIEAYLVSVSACFFEDCLLL